MFRKNENYRRLAENSFDSDFTMRTVKQRLVLKILALCYIFFIGTK